MQTDVNEWTILQDYRSKSVLSGLSALGGLGSFVSTMLALVLGTSLARVLFRTSSVIPASLWKCMTDSDRTRFVGSKPNSPFGLLHNLEAVRKPMVVGCKEQYPRLRDEIINLEKPEERGIQAYLFDTLIDLETLGYGKQVATTSATSGATNPANGHNHVKEAGTGTSSVRSEVPPP